MSIFSGTENAKQRSQQRPLWLAAFAGALVLHVLIITVLYWPDNNPLTRAPAAAPIYVEVSVVAAPKMPKSEQTIAPAQQESSPAPQKKHHKHEQVVASSNTKQLLAPLLENKAEVNIQETVDPKTPDSTIKDTKTTIAQEPTQAPTEHVPEPVIEMIESQQNANSSGNNSGEKYVETSSAPISINSDNAKQVTAPQIGAISQQTIEAIADWQSILLAHLERRKRYPSQAKMRGQQGSPWVKFTLDRQGKVLSVELHKSSGFNALDREVVALVKRAQPLPIPPKDSPDSALTIAVPVAFYIR
ncbi:energy transducer TonB [Endozoicomonas sp. G2_1]|uniref:energy transducer TonB n=1 Tax=Endozoicomonas sp. G2_1 TaxID=2821091 RepID=UPI001ADCB7FD|nr:energy transducer TonB [Endozoicomonas sp. G2_1]MBO9489686.1 energy transducer TonB [Endozoicomonas sp. G2_1]